MKTSFGYCVGLPVLVVIGLLSVPSTVAGDTAPSSYTAYTGVDAKPLPPAPLLGPANSVITDPTFGSRILRVTDQSTKSGQSFISTDSGSFRAWNADSTALKLTGPRGDGYWLEFDPTTFKVGDGSSRPAVHPLSFGANWDWSTIDPDIMYYLNGNQIASYNKLTGARIDLGGPSSGDPLGYTAVVVGRDYWVCAAAGPGIQDSRYKIFCLNPVSPSTNKLIDVYTKTVNGVPQGDPQWPTSAVGKVIGIHDIAGGTGASWLEVTFHQQSWGANGGAIFNLATNTWSLITNTDSYWSGHVSMGNGAYVNSSGSIDGRDSRGMVLRNPDNVMNSADYKFISQPRNDSNGWCDTDHSSWLNSVTNPNAPILTSRYGGDASCYQHAWTGEIDAVAVDGSNAVWRFAHNHNAGFSCYYGQAFAQISNDGKWALFSSYWDGTLGVDTAFGCSNRIDTFIVDLMSATPVTTPSGPPSSPSNLVAVCTGATQVTVSWSPVSTANSYYLRINDLANGGSTLPDYLIDDWSLTAFTANVKSGHDYIWWVHSANVAGLSRSAKATFSCPSVAPPPAATDNTAAIISSVSVANITSSAASINWTTNEPADSQVEFASPCPSTGCLTAIVSRLDNSHTVDVLNLAASTSYIYRVRSKDAAGNLSISASQTFTTSAPPANTPATRPNPPSNLAAVCNSPTQVTVSWAPVSTASSYYLRINDLSNGVGTTPNYVIDEWSPTTFTASVQSGQAYIWWVHAANSAGLSPSAKATFTCP